jgi:hypothetical protein
LLFKKLGITIEKWEMLRENIYMEKINKSL